MKLISNSMSAKWKLSFVASVAWLVAMWINGFTAGFGPDEDLLITGIVPITIWVAVRWLAIGNSTQEGE